ncbi:MAG: hypothetical protein WCA77_03260 [Thermoplasmata archaeon]
MRSIARRRSKWLSAAALIGVVLLLPALSSAWPGTYLHEGSQVRTAQGACSVTVTVSAAIAFAVSNDYCTTSHIALEMLETSASPHTFTLSPAANYSFNSNNMTSDLQSFFSAHPPVVNIVPAPTPGAANFTNFTMPGTIGVFEFVCMEQGHFQEGMYGFIGINMTPPGGGGGPTAPGAAVFIIAGTIAGLVVIAIVLGFVVGRRRGSEEEMPPERLGYPEPEAPLTSHEETMTPPAAEPGAKR